MWSETKTEIRDKRETKGREKNKHGTRAMEKRGGDVIGEKTEETSIHNMKNLFNSFRA